MHKTTRLIPTKQSDQSQNHKNPHHISIQIDQITDTQKRLPLYVIWVFEKNIENEQGGFPVDGEFQLHSIPKNHLI